MKHSQILANLGENTGVASAKGSLGKLIGDVFTIAVSVGAMFVFYQLVMGALNWINSAGDKEKITKAQKQITNSLVGLLLLVLVWVLFFTVAGEILGILTKDGNKGYILEIPSLFPK